MSPDAKANTIRRFTPPASVAGESITLLEETTVRFAAWHPSTDCRNVSI